MPICPNCGMEYIAGINECNDCHIPLVYNPKENNNPFDYSDLVVLLPLENEVQGAILQSILIESGIRSVIHDFVLKHDPGVQYHQNAWGVLLVLDSDYENAKFIVSEYLNSLDYQ